MINCIQPTLTFEITDLIIDKVAEQVPSTDEIVEARPLQLATPSTDNAGSQFDYGNADVLALAALQHDIRRLQQRKMTLKICSLVARSWLPRSRHHLFRVHHVYFLRSQLTESLAFLDLLGSPFSTIVPHIRHLTVEVHRQEKQEAGRLNDQMHLLAALTSLESFCICNAKLQLMNQQSLSQFFGSFPNLRKLDIRCTHFSDMAQFSRLLNAIPNLQQLSLDWIDIKAIPRSNLLSSAFRFLSAAFDTPKVPPACPDEFFPPPPASLTMLDIQHIDANARAEILQWLASRPFIERLRLSTSTPKDVPAVARYLYLLGPSLKELSIQISDQTDSQEAFCRAVDLAHNAALHTIRFSLSIYTHYHDRHLRGIHIPPLLSQIKTRSIEEIHIHVNICVPSDLDVIEWDKIEAIINRPNYSGLKRLVIAGLGEAVNLREMARKWMAERIPATQAKGIVFCE